MGAIPLEIVFSDEMTTPTLARSTRSRCASDMCATLNGHSRKRDLIRRRCRRCRRGSRCQRCNVATVELRRLMGGEQSQRDGRPERDARQQ